MNDTPTPRTTAARRINHFDKSLPKYIVDVEVAEQLERELSEARKQLADWQVLQSATEQELSAERALPANLLDVHAICDQRDKAVDDLQRERALADSLAGCLELALAGWDSAQWTAPIDPAEVESSDAALAAWKASRDQNQTKEER